MSFEELAKRTAGHPSAQAHVAAKAAELARKPWHDEFLACVYPSWQGPLVQMSRKAGIESATHSVAPGLPAPAVLVRSLPPRDWLISESLVVTAAVGVAAWIAYAFAGDENDGAMVRLAGTRDQGAAVVDEMTKVWAGPRTKLIMEAVDDVPAAAPLFGTLLVRALDAKEARIEAEAEAAREVEARRIEAEAKAEMDAIERRKAAETAAHPDNQAEAEQTADE